MSRSPIRLLFVAALLLLLSSVGAPKAEAREVVVRMLPGNQFSPASITINVGDKVTWMNADTVPHTSTSTDRVWDSGTVRPGQRFSYTFKQAGNFPYVCLFHAGMQGTVTVASAQQPAATQPAAHGRPTTQPSATAAPTSQAAAPTATSAGPAAAEPTAASSPVPTVAPQAPAEPTAAPPSTTGASRNAAVGAGAVMLLAAGGVAAWLFRRH